ncbi:hypothetical protein C8R45DRAFT_933431 [Mycena sanguinolenta]|nr:hypothetical protein C8R45DRAFT_933431 [Mycena sanguinolenta]
MRWADQLVVVVLVLGVLARRFGESWSESLVAATPWSKLRSFATLSEVTKCQVTQMARTPDDNNDGSNVVLASTVAGPKDAVQDPPQRLCKVRHHLWNDWTIFHRSSSEWQHLMACRQRPPMPEVQKVWSSGSKNHLQAPIELQNQNLGPAVKNIQILPSTNQMGLASMQTGVSRRTFFSPQLTLLLLARKALWYEFHSLPESRLPTEVWGWILEDIYDKSTLETPLVRECRISVHKLYSDHPDWSFSTDTPYILLNALFGRLFRFTGLRLLDASNIPFAQPRLNILCRLPHLPELRVSGCTVTLGEPSAPIPETLNVSNFVLWHYSESELGRGEEHWIPLLHPEHLHILQLSFKPRFMARAVHTLPSFPNVHTFTASFIDTTPSQNWTIMSRFPGVRILILRGEGFDTDAISQEAAAVFPRFQEYYGPHQALSCSRPEDLLTRIQGMPVHNIASFNAKFKQFDMSAFFFQQSSVVELLPQLRELVFNIVVTARFRLFNHEVDEVHDLPDGEVVDDNGVSDSIRCDFEVSTFFLELSAAPFLPLGLERFAIHWESDEDNELSAYILPDFAKICDEFVVRCLGLIWVWFNGIYSMFEWWLMSNGRVKELIGKNFGKCGFLPCFRVQLMLHNIADVFWQCDDAGILDVWGWDYNY